MQKTPRLAGTNANEYNMFVADKDSLDKRLQVMRRAAAEAGRGPR
jgi:alkanesulfonate monooxygenase SsuD/methylene tetrahydromethanopterin reductase-like flavin-dependent oxidoreductase (luciferase family)